MSLLLLQSGSGGTLQILSVGAAFESELALSTISIIENYSYDVTAASENEAGSSVVGGIEELYEVGQASELEISEGTIPRIDIGYVNRTSESEVALGVIPLRDLSTNIGIAFESENISSIRLFTPTTVFTAFESENASSTKAINTKILGIATESENGVFVIGQIISLDTFESEIDNDENNDTSIMVEDEYPKYITEDGNLVTFTESYYEYLEEA